MKRAIAILMSVLLFTLTACTPGKSESSEPKLAADTQKEKAASAAAEESADKGENVLQVATDIDCLSSSFRTRGDTAKDSKARDGQKVFRNMLEHCGGTPNGLEVRLKVLDRESISYESELTHMRTEIMAGGGPDVFLMSGFGGGDRALPENTLFQNPGAAIKKGLFLPLDEHIETARFMDMEKLHSKVMDAGVYEGKRYILPMFYRISFGWANKIIDPAELPSRWQEAVSSGDGDIRAIYGGNLAAASFRQVVFGQTYFNEELLLQKEDFFQRTKEAVELYRESWLSSGLSYEERGCFSWGDGLAGRFTGSTPGDNTYFAPRNSEGGLSAAIEHWCAVNANTKHPEDAFFIADMLLGADFLKLENFWDKNPRDSSPHAVALFSMMQGGNIPVYTDYMTTKISYTNTVIYKDMQKALAEAESEIDYVYFTSNADRAMDSMFRGLIEKVENGEDIPEDELRLLTDKTHSTLKMMLAES